MITFLYKNILKNAIAISESNIPTSWGPQFLFNGELSVPFRSDPIAVVTDTYLYTLEQNLFKTDDLFFTEGTSFPQLSTYVRFDFGSAVYIDSAACVTNLTSSGSCWVKGGNAPNIGDFVVNLPLDGLGTSVKFFDNQGYRYWTFGMEGATILGKHQCNELFLGKRLTINEMPSYPLSNSIEANLTELTSESGQKWVYSNYERENFIFNFEGVSNTTESALYNMYRYVRKNTEPFWMNLDISNPNNSRFVRFKDNAFLSSEVTKNIFNITLEVESEI